MTDPWLDWIRRIQAICQMGLEYSENPFDQARYQELRMIALTMLEARCELPSGQALELFRHETGPATPRVDVRGAVFQDERVLLVRERADGCWTLPGGWADVGEPPSRAVEREIREESGYEARAVKLAAVYDRDRQGHPPGPYCIYKIFFLCDLLGGSQTTSIETDGVGFFPLSSLPALSLGRTTEAQLRRMLEHRRRPELPTDFD